MKKITYLTLLTTSIFFLVGCASTPIPITPGMSLKDAETIAQFSSFGGIKYYGNHPILKDIEIYTSWDKLMSEKYDFYKSDPNKAGLFYFQNGYLVSADYIQGLLEKIEVDKRRIIQQRKEYAEKIEAENAEYIKKQNILNASIARNKVEIEKNLKNKEIILVYEKNDFAILKNNKIFIYLKNGVNVSESVVEKDISEYKISILNQKNSEKQLQENLRRNWYVTAQGKNVGNSTCNVISISSKGRDEIGNAIFQISFQCRTPKGSGNSGSITITCGIDRQINHNNTNFSAQCR